MKYSIAYSAHEKQLICDVISEIFLEYYWSGPNGLVNMSHLFS